MVTAVTAKAAAGNSMKPPTGNINHPTLEEAVNHINNIDFSSINESYARRTDYSAENGH